MYNRIIFTFFVIALVACSKDEVELEALKLNRAYIGTTALDLSGGKNENMPIDQAISLEFSTALNKQTVDDAIALSNQEGEVDISVNVLSGDKNVAIFPAGALLNSADYKLIIGSALKGANGEVFEGKSIDFQTILGDLILESVKIGEFEITNENLVLDVPLALSLEFTFNYPVDKDSFEAALKVTGKEVPAMDYNYSNDNRTIAVVGQSSLIYLSKYNLEIKNTLTGAEGEAFGGYALEFFSELDTTPKFPEIPDEELLTKVQEYAFKYFWDFGHPVSGLSRERNTSGETVASGGSGFGLMAIIVGIERGFISRAEGVARLKTMIGFLEQADRFHGAWSHWLNGTSGKAIPFSAKDDGGDLVETSYAAMGMLTVRQYLDANDVEEAALIDQINDIEDGIEWDWYTQGENALYWHWSPNYNFEMNMKIRGWNEALITYIMAAASETHGISTEVYENGWKNSDRFLNGREFYGIKLPLGRDYGGPLFFEQYTYLGIDPRNLADAQVDYWEQAVNHTLINREHCIVNPKNFVGYSQYCWGLTASDGNEGYSAHSPTNDRGVITPTAALSSFPFTPQESMDALKHFYYMLGDRTWGPYGFYDAFNITAEWYANSNIAIDQGPILLMIENHRTGLLWDLFMSSPEVKQALDKLGFTY